MLLLHAVLLTAVTITSFCSGVLLRKENEDLRGRSSGRRSGDDHVSFVVLADWGGLPIIPYHTFIETAVAKQMGSTADTIGSKFTLALGDNFYYDGVKNVHDKRFQRTYEKVFKASSLDTPWYFVAGNHDHNGNVSAQIAYTDSKKRWNFPDFYYVLNYTIAPDVTLEIVMIDTVLLCGNSDDDFLHKQPEMSHDPESWKVAEDQWEWIDRTLSKSSVVPFEEDMSQIRQSSCIGNLLDRNKLRVAVALRLGSSMCHPHKCICGTLVDVKARHGLSCNKSVAGRHSRHSGLNNIVQRSLVAGGYPAILEPSGLSASDDKRPDGMTVHAWSHGKNLVWDVTCVDSFCKTHVKNSSTAPGAAATEAETGKDLKYSFLKHNHVFVPLGFETTGTWVFSVAEHGSTQCLVDRLFPLLHKYKVQAYLCGHDHNLQHIEVNANNWTTEYMGVGAANFIEDSQAHLNTIPPDSLRFYWADVLKLGGFGVVQADKDIMTFRFIDAQNGNTLHGLSMYPTKNRRSF